MADLKDRTKRWPIGDLHEDPRNARRHPEENRDAIRRSLERFGQVEPLVGRRRPGGGMEIIAGNGRLGEMKRLGWSHADVVDAGDIDDARAKELAIALNRTAELAEWDPQILHGILDSIDVQPFELGFDKDFMRDLERRIDIGDVNEDAPAIASGDPISKAGERYQLGPHVLVCGDCTIAGVIESAIGGARVDLVVTDPPYGVDYRGGYNPDGLKRERRAIANDALSDEDFEVFLRTVFDRVVSMTRTGACWYVFAPAGRRSEAFHHALNVIGVRRAGLVWVKDRPILGHGDFHYRHEDIHYGWTPGGAHDLPIKADGRQDRTVDSVWEVPAPKRSKDHPTEKPVELYARAMRLSSAPGDLVLDPFAGSGTALMAAAETGRKAALVEIDPLYCDVIRRRWTTWANDHDILPGPDGI